MSTQAAHQCKAVNTFKEEKKKRIKKTKLGAHVNNFVRTFATEMHTHNNTHIYSGCVQSEGIHSRSR